MSSRKLNIEFIRVFAIMMTVVIHVSNVYLRSYGEISRFDFAAAAVFNSFSRACVPLFFMIGGIFAIRSELSKDKYLARIKKFLIVLVFWSIVYYFINNGFHFDNFWSTLVGSFFNAEQTSRHLWYMYPLIGLYIALPFIQILCKNMKREHENLFLFLWVLLSGAIFSVIAICEALSNINVSVSYPIPIINSAYYLGYFMGGYILYNRFCDSRFSKKQNRICIGVFLLSTLALILKICLISFKNDSYFESGTWYRSTPVIAAAFALFIVVVANGDKFKSPKITSLSQHTFGIYLIHIVFFNIAKRFLEFTDYPAIIAIPLLSAAIYLLSLYSCKLLAKVPVLNKIIF